MKLLSSMKINGKGILEIGGCSAIDLIEQFGSPLYVMDEGQIRANCREYTEAFRASYPDFTVLYASKVFLAAAMCKLVEEEGLGIDVVSGGEIYTALKAGFPMEKAYFHGNNKLPEEINLALDSGVGHFVIDNMPEIDLLEGLTAAKGKTAKVLLRVSPGIDAHTHSFIKTGLIDSKFGVAISNGQAMEAIKRIAQKRHLKFVGIHCHIGSQIFDLASYNETVEVMVGFVTQIKKETGMTVEELNLGGGLGIYYSEGDEPKTLSAFVENLVKEVKANCAKHGLDLPRLLIEPGRSMVGETGCTLYTIGTVKEIPGIRKYVSIDGGMTDNPRPALYDAKYEAALANRMLDKATEKVSIAGKCCESGDMLIKDIELPPVAKGDILVVSSTGAYNYSMSSNYNRNLKPAVVFVQDGRARVVVKRETYEDLIRNDILP